MKVWSMYDALLLMSKAIETMAENLREGDASSFVVSLAVSELAESVRSLQISLEVDR